MDGSESSMNRLGRTIWTVWGYLSGAVGRYLRPEVSNEDKRNAEDAAADVTVSKSYRELKENEEEKERSETKACDQGVSPQTGIRVRAAAVQWEKASVRKSGTSRQAGTGTGVVVEGIDQKAQEQKRGEKTSENNNEAVGARSRDFAEEAFVDAPASIEANTGGQDFGISRSERVERVIDGVAKKESAEKAAVSSENAGQDVELEELTNERGRESLAKVSEEKVVKDAEDQDGNEESEEEQGKWGTTEGQDETCASPMADDVLSQLTYSTREREDLLKAPSNKDLKVDEKHQEETTEAKAERELIGAGDEETKQGTQGAIKDGQHEEGQQLRESIQDVEVQDIYKFELEKAQTEVGEGRAVAVTCKPGTTQVEKAEMSEEESEPDGHHEAGQLNICESGHQDEPQLGFTEEVVGIVEIVEIGKAPEPISTGTENEVTPTPERDPNKATEEAKQVAVRTVKEGQYEAEIDLTESKLVEAELVESRCEKEVWETEPEPIPPTTEREVIDLIEESMQVTLETTEGEQQLNESKFAETVDLGESKLDESPTEFTEQIAKMEHEPLEEPGTGQVENADIWINEPEPVGKSTENEAAPEPVCVTKETRQVTLETIEDDQHEVSQQWGETKFAESFDLCKLVTPSDSKFPETVDEHPTEFTEEGAMTERDLLEEPVAEHMEVVEVHEEDLEPSSKGTENEEASTPETDPVNVAEEDEKHEAKQQFREPTFAESESKPNESRTEFTEEDATTECDLLEEPVTGRMEGAEVCEEDLEPISEGIENEAALTPEKESFSILEESKQVIEETIEDEQHEISQELSDSKFEATENEAAPEPVCVTKETRQVTLETIEDDQHEVSQQWGETKFAESVDLCKLELDEHPTEFTEGRVKTEHGLLEEPITGHLEVVDLEPSSKGTENEAALIPGRESISALEESRQGTVGTVKEGQHEADLESGEFTGSEIADKLDIQESKLEETQTVFSEGMVETEREPLEEPGTGQVENADICEKESEPISKGTENKEAPTPETEPVCATKETREVTLETIEDEQHEVSQQWSESRFAEIVDLCKSELDEHPTAFTEGRVKTECGLLEEPMTGRMDVVEVYEEDLEPSSKTIENEAALTPEKESISVLEQSKQVTEGTIEDEQHEISQESSDSKFPETVDEHPTEFTEEGAKTERDLLEEPVAEHMEVVEVHEEDLEPSSKGTENEEASTPETDPISVAEEDEKHEAKQQFCEPTFAESESKPNESRTEFTEEDATTECDLLEEPVMGRMEGAEVCEEDLEPISEGIENEAALTPEKESFSVLEESKQVIEETIEDEQHEISQELSDSKFAETVDLCESEPKETLTEGRTTAERNLLEEPAGEQMEKDLELSSKGTENEAALVLDSEASDVLNEATAQEIVVALKSGLQEVDQQLCEQFIGEKLDLLGPKLREPRSGFTEEMVEPEYEPSSTTELGSSEAALKTKVEQLDDTVCDLVIPEVAIKQDRESVIALAAEEPGNQSETAEFQQEVRAEVAADVVKKPAELERRLHELPIAREQLALQETMGQSTLAQGSLQEIAFDGNGNELGSAEEQLRSMQRETREIESGSAEQAVETANESVDVMPSSSPQELDKSGDSIATSVDVVTGLTAEVEVLEACTELTAVSGHVVTEEKCEKAESETDALKEDSESTLTTGETSETIRRSEASILDDASGSQGLLSQGEWTVRDRSAVEPHGHQMGYSGELSLPESEPALDGRMQKDSGKGCKDVESPDEAEVGLLEDMDEKVRTASLGVVEGIMRGLKQEFEERPSLLTRDADEKKGWTKTKGEYLEPSESSSAFLQVQCEFSDGTVKDRQNVQVEAMDVGHDEDCLKMESVDLGVYEDKKAGGEKLVVDRNANVQKISRPGLKRGFEKLAKDEVDKPPLSKEWAGKIVLQQVSALDCTVQKSKIAVKNPLVRPPKDPRTLINKASVEPLAPTRPSQPSPLRKVQAEGISVPQKGVIGFKLPGLGAGFPALKKTDAGRKIREEGDAESVSTQSPPDQKSDTETEPKEDSVKQEQPVNKPKWTPPRHPGMGNPLMMSELKSKLKKTGKE